MTKSTEVTTTSDENRILLIERLVIDGDLSVLSAEDRLTYYKHVCKKHKLDWELKPFEYIKLPDKKDDNGVMKYKLTLYATKGCAELLRATHGIEIYDLKREFDKGLCIVTATGRTKDGRIGMDVGFASVNTKYGDATGDFLGNAILKAVTKAQRRLTLSLGGLGMLDETEVESIAGAIKITDVTGTGTIGEKPKETGEEVFKILLNSSGKEGQMGSEELFTYLEGALQKCNTIEIYMLVDSFFKRNQVVLQDWAEKYPAQAEMVQILRDEKTSEFKQ